MMSFLIFCEHSGQNNVQEFDMKKLTRAAR